MSVTRDTAHSLMGPCGSSAQSPFGDSVRHASTALRISSLDCGEKAVAEGRGSGNEFQSFKNWCQYEGQSLYEAVHVYVHTPLQEFDEMLIRNINSRIQKCEDNRFCA